MVDLQSMMLTFNQNLPGMFQLARGAAFTVGIILMVRVLFKLRRAADYRSMMYQPTELIGPMVGVAIASALIYWPVYMDAVTDTVFARGEILSPSFNSGSYFGRNAEIAEAVLGVLKLIGLIAFIRGWLLLLRATDQGSAGQGFAGKGIAHIISGMLAWHFWWTVQMLGNTFGINMVEFFGQG